MQRLLQHLGVQRRELEAAGAAAVTVVPQGEPGGTAGLPLLVLELLALLLVGRVRVDHLEQPAAQDPQRLGVELLGLGDEVGLGAPPVMRRDSVGQVEHGPDDHPSLLLVQPPSGEGSSRRLEGRVEVLGEP